MQYSTVRCLTSSDMKLGRTSLVHHRVDSRSMSIQYLQVAPREIIIEGNSLPLLQYYGMFNKNDYKADRQTVPAADVISRRGTLYSTVGVSRQSSCSLDRRHSQYLSSVVTRSVLVLTRNRRTTVRYDVTRANYVCHLVHTTFISAACGTYFPREGSGRQTRNRKVAGTWPVGTDMRQAQGGPISPLICHTIP